MCQLLLSIGVCDFDYLQNSRGVVASNEREWDAHIVRVSLEINQVCIASFCCGGIAQHFAGVNTTARVTRIRALCECRRKICVRKPIRTSHCRERSR